MCKSTKLTAYSNRETQSNTTDLKRRKYMEKKYSQCLGSNFYDLISLLNTGYSLKTKTSDKSTSAQQAVHTDE